MCTKLPSIGRYAVVTEENLQDRSVSAMKQHSCIYEAVSSFIL